MSGGPRYKKAVIIFRRDLRLFDNTALLRAVSEAEEVLPLFCADPRQLGDNPYRGNAAVYFMARSLEDLEAQLATQKGQLYYYEGTPEDALLALETSYAPDALYFNQDYTPFSISRDSAMVTAARARNIACHGVHDTLLNAPGTVLKKDGTPYTVFTPFMRKARTLEVQNPVPCTATNFATLNHKAFTTKQPAALQASAPSHPLLHGGRSEATKLLERLDTRVDYDKERDIPSLHATSLLAAHHKFGTCSVRETFHRTASLFGQDHTLTNELYWRDFFTHIGFHFPHVFGKSFRKEYDRIRWSKSEKNFDAWCRGMTGFPLVDAGMRELVQTGYMHNRVRMVTASFLMKDLFIDWRKGERFFAQHLMDYDPAVNNGNWQWAASTGCDAQPYFRIFNPWRQQQRFDPECVYIKKWIPELANLSPREIHKLESGRSVLAQDYPPPLVDHAIARETTLEKYKAVRG